MHNDAPLNSLKNSTTNFNVKTMEERVGAHFITRNTSKVKRACWNSKIMGTRMNDKHINYSYQFTQIKQQVD